MHFSLLLVPVLVPVLVLSATLTSATPSPSASPSQAMNIVERDILHYKNWDLRLLTPGCVANASASNTALSIYHYIGYLGRNCTNLNTTRYNEETVDSVSWKSPTSMRFDLCLFENGGCADGDDGDDRDEGGNGLVRVIRDGWEVCLPFTEWKSFLIVPHGRECVEESNWDQ